MNLVYVRLAVYIMSVLAGFIPASWAGFVSYSEATASLTISLEGLGVALVTGAAGSLAVFKKWGKK